jgi:hypothetical protein
MDRVALNYKPKRPKYGGRKPGALNKLPAELKECILQAVHDVGEIRYVEIPGDDKDRKPKYKRLVDGLDGATGYMRFLAIEHPTTMATLLGRVLPLQVLTQFRGELEIRHYQSIDDARASARARGLPIDTIEQLLLGKPTPATGE